ncbi:hypothetical protein bcgnr5372_30850 [Bacillus luti]
MIAQPTVDYKKNPNLKGDVKQEKRYDWIMIQENAAFEFPTIENVSIFGIRYLLQLVCFLVIITVFLQIWNLISENNVV